MQAPSLSAAVGQVIEHAIRRTVTEADNTLFSVLTMNPQPLHLDARPSGAASVSNNDRQIAFALLQLSRLC